jgi:hypothetical protein
MKQCSTSDHLTLDCDVIPLVSEVFHLVTHLRMSSLKRQDDRGRTQETWFDNDTLHFTSQ